MDLLAFIVGIPLLLFYFLRNWIAAYDAREADKELRKDPESTTERSTVQDFRKDCLRELKKIKLAWPGAELHHSSGGPDPASLAPCHPSGTRTPAPRGIAPRFLPRRRAR